MAATIFDPFLLCKVCFLDWGLHCPAWKWSVVLFSGNLCIHTHKETIFCCQNLIPPPKKCNIKVGVWHNIIRPQICYKRNCTSFWNLLLIVSCIWGSLCYVTCTYPTLWIIEQIFQRLLFYKPLRQVCSSNKSSSFLMNHLPCSLTNFLSWECNKAIQCFNTRPFTFFVPCARTATVFTTAGSTAKATSCLG